MSHTEFGAFVMSIPQRFYRIARYKLSELKDRFDRMDAEAQEDWEAEQKRRQNQYSEDARRELNDVLSGSSGAPPASAARSDRAAPAGPLPRRTPEEIARGVRPASPATVAPPTAPATDVTPAPDPLLYHYRLLG